MVGNACLLFWIMLRAHSPIVSSDALANAVHVDSVALSMRTPNILSRATWVFFGRGIVKVRHVELVVYPTQCGGVQRGGLATPCETPVQNVVLLTGVVSPQPFVQLSAALSLVPDRATRSGIR